MSKRICETCGKEIEEGEEVRANNFDYDYEDWVFHAECLEKEYEYNRDEGYM